MCCLLGQVLRHHSSSLPVFRPLVLFLPPVNLTPYSSSLLSPLPLQPSSQLPLPLSSSSLLFHYPIFLSTQYILFFRSICCIIYVRHLCSAQNTNVSPLYLLSSSDHAIYPLHKSTPNSSFLQPPTPSSPLWSVSHRFRPTGLPLCIYTHPCCCPPPLLLLPTTLPPAVHHPYCCPPFCCTALLLLLF